MQEAGQATYLLAWRAANWLAVEVSNHGARRLYQRLGYRDWGQGIVIDHWEETDAAGAELKRNADPCHYLTKPIE